MRKNILMQHDYESNKIDKILSTKIQQSNSILLINKKNLIFNANYISRICNKAIIAPVVKSDAYGIGINTIVKIYIKLGLTNFFVGNTDEAIRLRKKFININIFILNCGKRIKISQLKKYKLTPVINNINQITTWPNTQVPCVIHIDTGMNRLGLSEEEYLSDKYKYKFKNMKIKFLMSHLACADDRLNPLNTIQLLKLKKAQKYFYSVTGSKTKTSIANSSAIWLGKKYILDFVRPGAAFYGINPHINSPNPLKRVLYLYAHIVQCRIAHQYSTVGYGASYKLRKKSRLATISIGYSHGFSRLLSNIGSVFINNIEAKIVGRVSMDLTVIDITDFKDSIINEGDPVEIFGNNRSIDDFAKFNNTIAYEIICHMGRLSKKIFF